MEEQTTNAPVENETSANQGLVCPECGKKDIPNKRILGIHRWSQHGVKGVSRLDKPAKPPVKKTLGRPKGTANTKTSQPIQQKVIVPTSPVPTIGPELLGYALGKIETIAEQIARDNALPTQEFVTRVMEYYAVLTKRQ